MSFYLLCLGSARPIYSALLHIYYVLITKQARILICIYLHCLLCFGFIFISAFPLLAYTCRLPRSGLGPGLDVGLTDFGGAGCSTRVSVYRRA